MHLSPRFLLWCSVKKIPALAKSEADHLAAFVHCNWQSKRSSTAYLGMLTEKLSQIE
jgi:hypothetical protein